MRTGFEPIRSEIPSDCKAILTVPRVNFRKAGANYSPLQQNHPDALNYLPFKSSGENHPNPIRIIRQQAPV